MLEIAGGIILGVVGLWLLIWLGYGLLILAVKTVDALGRASRETERRQEERKSRKSMTWVGKVFLALCLGGIGSVFVFAFIESYQRSKPVLIKVGDYAFVCQRYPKVNCVSQEEWKGPKPREVTLKDWANGR